MWKDHLKFNVRDTVKIARDNDVWNGSVAEIVEITNDPRYPYLLLFRSSDRPNTVGEKFEWDEESLDRYDSQRERLDRVIKANFPRRIDVYYSDMSGGAVVMGDTGKLYRVLASGDIETEADPRPYGRRK